MGPLSKSEDRLDHRRPASHTCCVRRERPAIRSMVDAEQFCVEPQPLGWKEMPPCADTIFGRVAKLSKDYGSAGIKLELSGNNEVTCCQLKAVVKCRCQRKRSVGYEITQPAHEVLPVDREPVPLDAAVDRPHLV